MINIQDYIEKGNQFKKFKVDELLFAEIECPVDDDKSGSNLWWHHNFFAYALAGEMVLKTREGEHIFKQGDCIFVKKGSILSARHSIQKDFCELRIFVPDEFIRSVVQKHRISLDKSKTMEISDTITPLTADPILDGYFHSLIPYFKPSEPIPNTLMKLKFEELIVHVLSAAQHKALQNRVYQICQSTRPSISEIMDDNFTKNLHLEEFARLCGRSLSTFKVEFNKLYHTSPGKWLKSKRLEYSRYLLETTDASIDEVCFQSGFENSSHFNREFKNKYNLTPSRFKAQNF